MASPNIMAAIGAALQGGVQTFGRLRAEQEDKRRYEEEREARRQAMQQQAEFENRRLQMDQSQLDEQKRDREFRRLQAAIEGVAPNAVVSDDLYQRASEAGLGDSFSVKSAGETLPSAPGIGMGMGAAPLTLQKDFITRNPTFTESRQLEADRVAQEERDKISTFRTSLTNGEFAKLPFDQQVQQAFAAGVNNMPMSSTEWDRRNQKEFDQQKALAQIRASSGGNNTKTPGERWLASYNVVEDNLRQRYGAVISALAKADAEGTSADAGQKLAALQARIAAEARQLTEQMVGPMPTQAPQDAGAEGDPTQDVIANIDEDVKRFGGDFQKLKQHVLQNQAQLREAGIDVPAYVAAVRNRIPRRANIVGPGAEAPPREVGFFEAFLSPNEKLQGRR